MNQARVEDCGSDPGGTFVFQSRPNQSLTRPQERLFFWSLVAVCLTTASVFAAQGYWLLLPFAGLELWLLAWALAMLRSREMDYEVLVIDGDAVRLEWRCGNEMGRREMNRHWVRVECGCAARGKDCRLWLRSHGRATPIGRYLSDEARLELAATLRSRMQTG